MAYKKSHLRYPMAHVAPVLPSVTLLGISVIVVTSSPTVPQTAAPRPVLQSTNIQLTGLKLFGDGTANDPDGGLLGGNGYSYSARDANSGGACENATICNGGNAGLLWGAAGNGWNGGTGGNAGLFGNGGIGGDGVAAIYNNSGERVRAASPGGAGGDAGRVFGNGGTGGAGGNDCQCDPNVLYNSVDAVAGAGGNGGNSGLLAGDGGSAGSGGRAYAGAPSIPIDPDTGEPVPSKAKPMNATGGEGGRGGHASGLGRGMPGGEGGAAASWAGSATGGKGGQGGFTTIFIKGLYEESAGGKGGDASTLDRVGQRKIATGGMGGQGAVGGIGSWGGTGGAGGDVLAINLGIGVSGDGGAAGYGRAFGRGGMGGSAGTASGGVERRGGKGGTGGAGALLADGGKGGNGGNATEPAEDAYPGPGGDGGAAGDLFSRPGAQGAPGIVIKGATKAAAAASATRRQ